MRVFVTRASGFIGSGPRARGLVGWALAGRQPAHLGRQPG